MPLHRRPLGWIWRGPPLAAIIVLAAACTFQTPQPSLTTPPAGAGTPTPDLEATLQAQVQETIAAMATGTPAPPPTPGTGETPGPTSTPVSEAEATATPLPTPTPAPTPAPTPPPVDTDGDGLSDADEVAFGTNPAVEDTDGDGFPDQEEVQNWDRGGGNHLRFNPLVADVPRLQVEPLGAPVIQLYATTEESGTVRKGMTDEQSSEVQVTTSRGRTNVNEIEEQHAVNVNGEVQRSGAVTTAKVEASYDYQHTDTTTTTQYWDQTRVATNRQETSEYYETVSTETVTTTGGEIKVLVGLLNDGDVSYTVNNMELAAYMEDPRKPGNLVAVGTLRHDGPLSFTPDPLGPTADPGTVAFTPFNFVYRAEGNPDEISQILQSSNQLVLDPTNLSLTGNRPDVDLNLAAQNIRARTAEVIIDFGDHQGLKTERYRVAVDSGEGDELPFEKLMSTHLSFSYTFSREGFPGAGGSHNGLTSVRNVAMNSSTNSYWLVAHTFRPPGSAPGTTETDLYNILADDYQASDIRLRKGDVLHLVYVTDTDLDGVSDRQERLNGTRIDLADTDGDGLDDALEYYGWRTNLAGPPCDSGQPLIVVVSNPLEADTDSDGVPDDEEFASCANPQGELTVDAGRDRVVSTGGNVTLTARPDNVLDYGSLKYDWTQTAGPSVGQLPASPSITFPAPDKVTTLAFDVSVTDTLQNNQTATDRVSMLVARDRRNAVFVDPDAGHDFDNTGLSPESPLATLECALGQKQCALDFSGADVYLNSPDDGSPYSFTETVRMEPGTDDSPIPSIFGGFGEDWVRDPENAPTPIRVEHAVALELDGFSDMTLSGISVEASAPVDGSEHSYAIRATNGARLVLDRVVAQGSDLAVDPDVLSSGSDTFVSASSHGVFASDLDRLEVLNSTISSGKGADGPKGKPGNRGPGGKGGSNGGVHGGGGGGDGNGNGLSGGRGGNGAGGQPIVCAGGKGGSSGGSKGSVSGGSGGAAGSATYNFPIGCTTRTAGNGGTGGRGEAGAAGVPAEVSMEFEEAGAFVPTHGSAGKQGTGGGGGGGGGGGPGAEAWGGGGGGGGEGGGGGPGGTGGRGGGGSFALALYNVAFASIDGSRLESNNGGSGGAGGDGGRGGAGGPGGIGGKPGTSAFNGGNGGRGGSGGPGGDGGGGAGGPTAGLLLLGSTEAEVGETEIVTGDAGNGTSPNPGQGGWNYGVFRVAGTGFTAQSGVSYQLGSAGNDAPAAADVFELDE